MKVSLNNLLARFSQISMTAIYFICISLALFITAAWVLVFFLSYAPGYAGIAVTIFATIHSLVSAQIVLRMIREHDERIDLLALSTEITMLDDKMDEVLKAVRS